MTQAKPGDTVRIHYVGRLSDGTEFDSSVDRDPIEFTIGAGHIVPGLEQGVIGMEVGDRSTVEVGPDQAYGKHDPGGVQQIPRSTVPGEIDLTPGRQLRATTREGQEIGLTVVDVSDETVTLDANHPLAGKDLVFEVELVEIL